MDEIIQKCHICGLENKWQHPLCKCQVCGKLVCGLCKIKVNENYYWVCEIICKDTIK
jgi:hypothetical protein